MRDGGEAVGFFAVEDVEDLIFWVDEVTDPADCEYAEIGSGSIIWEGRAASLPLQFAEDGDEESSLSALAQIGPHDLGGTWTSALFSDELEYEPLVSDREIVANDP